jgi:hypothetical protein
VLAPSSEEDSESELGALPVLLASIRRALRGSSSRSMAGPLPRLVTGVSTVVAFALPAAVFLNTIEVSKDEKTQVF